MSHYDLPQLLKKWKIAALTPEQAIGQILLNLQALSNRIGEAEQKLERLRRRGEKAAVPSVSEPAAPPEPAETAPEPEPALPEATSEPAAPAPLASSVAVTAERLIVNFHDGRALYVPLDWYPRLVHATPAERQTWELLEHGRTVTWPKLEETIGIEALLNGQRSGESTAAFEKWLAKRAA